MQKPYTKLLSSHIILEYTFNNIVVLILEQIAMIKTSPCVTNGGAVACIFQITKIRDESAGNICRMLFYH